LDEEKKVVDLIAFSLERKRGEGEDTEQQRQRIVPSEGKRGQDRQKGGWA